MPIFLAIGLLRESHLLRDSRECWVAGVIVHEVDYSTRPCGLRHWGPAPKSDAYTAETL